MVSNVTMQMHTLKTSSFNTGEHAAVGEPEPLRLRGVGDAAADGDAPTSAPTGLRSPEPRVPPAAAGGCTGRACGRHSTTGEAEGR